MLISFYGFLTCRIYRYEPGPSVGFAQLSPAVLAESNRQGTGTPVSNSTDGHLISGVFGGPTLPANGSTITGSPLDSMSSPTSTPAAPAPAGNQPSTISLSTSWARRRSVSTWFTNEYVNIAVLFGIIWLSIWTLGSA